MHNVRYTIRHIAPSDLPKVRDERTRKNRVATRDELLNLGIQPLGNDLYSCVEQLTSDDRTDVSRNTRGELHRRWSPVGDAPPGTVLSEGPLYERHARLPEAIRAKILQAYVLRATKKRENARRIVDERLAARRRSRTKRTADADRDVRLIEVEEAHAAAADPMNSLQIVHIPMAHIDRERDVVLEEHVIPHRWAGEL
jgi:hypothetical protein